MSLIGLVAVAKSATNSTAPSCCRSEAAEAKAITDKSVYQLTSAWTNDSGKTVTLKELRGRFQVVTMFFANCPMACPVLVHDMQSIEASLPSDLRNRIGFTLVSFDTERDTPGALHRYRAQHDLPEASWTLLRGSPDSVQELAAVLGVNYKKDSQGQFAHSNVITLLNEEGEIVWQQTGLNQNSNEWINQIRHFAHQQK